MDKENSALVEQMLNDRRHIHRRPELGWTEFETTSFVANRLKSLGINYQLGIDFLDIPSVQGRDEKSVTKAIGRALEHGVSQEFIEKTGGYTGVVGILDTNRPGPTIAIRADLQPMPPTTFQ